MLGDLDTACAMAGVEPEGCGSAAVIGYILTPPVWTVSLSVAVALAWFWFWERQRERLHIDALDKLIADFWALSAEYQTVCLVKDGIVQIDTTKSAQGAC